MKNLKTFLGEKLPGYEYRPEQEAMAAAVLDALKEGKNLIVEAGTGVGKSLAYLIPVILWINEDDKRRVVVTTYTKVLQRQLYEKDLPFIREKLFPGVKYALCLGSENYLCLKRLSQCKNEGLFEDSEGADMARLVKWRASADMGIRAEVEVDTSLWLKVCRQSDLCFGRSCDFFKECFYQKAKTIERNSDILITNHHLFFANVASGYNVLPPFNAVVFDEAHEIEDAAADYLGIEVSNFRVKHLLDTILNQRGKGLLKRIAGADPELTSDIEDAVNWARSSAEGFFREVLSRMDKQNTLRIRQENFYQDTLSGPLTTLEGFLNGLAASAAVEEQQKELEAVSKRCRDLCAAVGTLLRQEAGNSVYWAETSNKTVRLSATPINISELLSQGVFGVVRTSILTSATLSTGGDFQFIKNTLGVKECGQALLASPFDFRRQALLYVPGDIPEPSSPDYAAAVTARIDVLIEKARGGKTMALFTNYALLKRVADSIGGGVEVFAQGDTDNYRLVERFKRAKGGALLGTYSFWQGVDFPADELECVIITKLPFGVPTDPVMEGRLEYITAAGRDPFYGYQVPRAVIMLRQGFGRLIRTKSDRGVVAILDCRILKKGYGRIFLESLPEVEMTDDILKVESFFRGSDNA
jgi:ATP-dependent DNA helicase DinG